MRAFSLFLASIFFAGAFASSHVLDLNNDNFDKAVEEKNPLLVEFYAPWCGHCKTLAPKYEEAAEKLTQAHFAKVDCTVAEEVCQRFGVKGYPTLKLFRGKDAKPSDYQGGRESNALVSFMKKHILPDVSVIEADKIKDLIESEKVVVLAFVDSLESDEYKTFVEVAKNLRDDYVFGVTTDKAALKAYEVTKTPAIILFKQFDEGKNVFEEKISKTELTNFIKANSVPVMDEIGPSNYQKFVDSGLPLAYLFVLPEHKKTTGPLVEAAAREFKNKVNFVYIDAQQYAGHANNLNLKSGEWPAFSIQNPRENTKFPFSGEISTKAIIDHVTGVIEGSIKPSIKSEPVPEKQGNVKIIVGKNYDEIVNQKKDVLVEFYAPWCGHCKKLAPIYDELGDFYATTNENIVIAKMDATENDLPAGTAFTVQGFPTIKLIKADNSVVDYNGDRSLDDFKKFLEKEATKTFDKTEEDTKEKDRSDL